MEAHVRFYAALAVGSVVWALSVLHGRIILLGTDPGPFRRARLSRWRASWATALLRVLRSFMRLKVAYRLPSSHALGLVRDGRCLIISNHQHSLIEPFVLPGLLEAMGLGNVRWVAKEEMRRAWGWGPMFDASGFAWVRRGGHASYIRAVEAAAAAAAGEGASFALFPEGTRAPLGQLVRPKAGGFLAAVRNMPEAPIVSVTFGWDVPPQGGNTMLDGAPLLGRTVIVTVGIGDPVREESAKSWLKAEWERKRDILSTGAS